MSLPNRVIGGGVRRLPQVNMTVSTSLRNRYISGANVGGVSTSNRRALKLRAERGTGTMDMSVILNISNPIFKIAESGDFSMRMAPVRFTEAPQLQYKRSISQPIPIAYHNVVNKITLIYINDVIDVTHDGSPMYISWILVQDEDLVIDITTENFDKAIHRGYFSTDPVTSPTKVASWYSMHIPVILFNKGVTSSLISIETTRNIDYNFIDLTDISILDKNVKR
jgi:hypothetical protein